MEATYFFEPKCMTACGCFINLQKEDPAVRDAGILKIEADFNNLTAFGNQLGQDFQKNVQPSADAYIKKAESLHEDFVGLLKKHAV
jgi:hypothetical protein